MEIIVNNEPVAVPDGITLQALADTLKLPTSGVAMLIDDSLAPRSKWNELSLHPGANLTTISAAYGG